MNRAFLIEAPGAPWRWCRRSEFKQPQLWLRLLRTDEVWISFKVPQAHSHKCHRCLLRTPRHRIGVKRPYILISGCFAGRPITLEKNKLAVSAVNKKS